MVLQLASKINGFTSHPQYQALATIIAGDTATSSAGFPIISEESFRLFLDKVPHLFASGTVLLEWLYKITDALKTEKQAGAMAASWLRALKVLTTIVKTAAVTAPTDLWLLHHVLSGWHRSGLSAVILGKAAFGVPELVAKGFSPAQLRLDIHFLVSRGLLTAQANGYYALTPEGAALLSHAPELSHDLPTDWVPEILRCLNGEQLEPEAEARLSRMLTVPHGLSHSQSWHPGPFEMAVGYRIVPLVLAFRNAVIESKAAQVGDLAVKESLCCSHEINCLFFAAGMIDVTGRLTRLGERVLDRGPGPFGIIHAYHPYMAEYDALLRGQKLGASVSRGENVAASQDANRKTFTMINDALDRFVARHGFRFKVFIEHAVGQGEAVRQRFKRSGENTISYFGADLEDAAIDRAVLAQQDGDLPLNMRFIRHADIGDPAFLLKQLAEWNVEPKGAVMVVGNGFHEVRNQNDEKMSAVFRAYNQAGILLIFTEESALSDADLLATAWNTYHAGFRYVHGLSGQGLRPAYDYDLESERYSWRRCAEAGGYWVNPRYSSHTRKIYPYPREGGYNPAISVNYFCIPEWLAPSIGPKRR